MASPEEIYASLADELAQQPNITRSQMFGMPCLKVSGKAFAVFHRAEMAFKLSGGDHRRALELEGACLFDPSGRGRPMKEWVRVPAAHAAAWKELAGQACAYVTQTLK